MRSHHRQPRLASARPLSHTFTTSTHATCAANALLGAGNVVGLFVDDARAPWLRQLCLGPAAVFAPGPLLLAIGCVSHCREDGEGRWGGKVGRADGEGIPTK